MHNLEFTSNLHVSNSFIRNPFVLIDLRIITCLRIWFVYAVSNKRNPQTRTTKGSGFNNIAKLYDFGHRNRIILTDYPFNLTAYSCLSHM